MKYEIHWNNRLTNSDADILVPSREIRSWIIDATMNGSAASVPIDAFRSAFPKAAALYDILPLLRVPDKECRHLAQNHARYLCSQCPEADRPGYTELLNKASTYEGGILMSNLADELGLAATTLWGDPDKPESMFLYILTNIVHPVAYRAAQRSRNHLLTTVQPLLRAIDKDASDSDCRQALDAAIEFSDNLILDVIYQ